MAAVFLAVLLRGVLATLPSAGGASAGGFFAVRLAAGFLAALSTGGVISAPAESALADSEARLTRSIAGASGAEDGGPAARLAARRRRGAGCLAGCSFVS
jgi:hypothetical protein